MNDLTKKLVEAYAHSRSKTVDISDVEASIQVLVETLSKPIDL